MQNKDASSPSSNGGLGAMITTITTTGQMATNGAAFDSINSTLFTDDKSRLSANSNGDSGIQNSLYESCLVQKHQDTVNRYSMCFARLVEISKDIEALRQENSQLRAANIELQRQLNLILASHHSQFDGSSGHMTPFDMVNLNVFSGFHTGHNYGDGKENFPNNQEQEVLDESPTSVIENNSAIPVERFSLPKSISVRSNGYLKMAQAATSGSNGSRTKGPARPRSSPTPPDVVQKVYVRGGKEEEPLEMVVYNQGMFKTELCNKWQETGTCPYRDHCQFAHGIEELRPVIRHPRYKTEVCRMVFAGVVCPYGHRCHFRHALTEQEEALVQPNPRAMKLER